MCIISLTTYKKLLFSSLHLPCTINLKAYILLPYSKLDSTKILVWSRSNKVLVQTWTELGEEKWQNFVRYFSFRQIVFLRNASVQWCQQFLQQIKLKYRHSGDTNTRNIWIQWMLEYPTFKFRIHWKSEFLMFRFRMVWYKNLRIVVSIEFSPLWSAAFTNSWYRLHNGDYTVIFE